jgi:predicted acetyltransferase
VALEFGLLDAADEPAYRTAVGIGFGVPEIDEPDPLQVVEADRCFAARDGGRYVGGAAAYTKQVTPAGLAEPVPLCAVANVAVVPTDTRRGVTSVLMGMVLDQAVERGEAVAALMASEATIYGRFGFGVGTRSVSVRLPSHLGAMRTPSTAGGSVRLVPAGDERKAVLAPWWDTFRRTVPGELDRSGAWWDVVFDPKERWIGGGTQFVAVHEPDGGGPVDGHCRYALKHGPEGSFADGTIKVSDMAAADPEVEIALWEFLFGVDLVSSVQCLRRPDHDLLAWRLADSRALATTGIVDSLWVRLLDVPVAMEARGYGGEGSLVLEVDDPFQPASGGRFQLDTGVGGATCKRTDAEPDLVLGVDALSALWLGGFWPSALAAAGRIEEQREGALAVADRLLPMAKSPLLQTPF